MTFFEREANLPGQKGGYMNFSRQLGLLGMALFAAGVLAAPARAGETLERIKKEGVVRVGITNQQPWAYKEPNGNLAGVAVEVTQAAFSSLGVKKLEPVTMDWGSMIPGLKANRLDVIIAGMFIRPAR